MIEKKPDAAEEARIANEPELMVEEMDVKASKHEPKKMGRRLKKMTKKKVIKGRIIKKIN